MKKLKKPILGMGIVLVLCGILVGMTMAEDSPSPQAESDEVVPSLPNPSFNYANVDLPDYYTNGRVDRDDNTPNNNPTTDAGATLGRVLFYDPILSANNTVSCASCHRQANGFSDPNQFSTGFEGGLTGRNSMGLANARFYRPGHFFWDERANTLEDQVLMPIQDSVEMGLTLPELESKVAAQSYYPALFEDAFGSSEINSERISLALAQFVRSMVSYQSKYDEGLAQDFDNFTRDENRGRRIFFSQNEGNCAACHGTEAITAPESRNNGLDLTSTDQGVGAVTGNPNDDGKFKAPSLRNIALTAPYMHDGRFQTLEQVIQFYNNGVQAHPNLDQRLQTPEGQPRRLNLDAQDQADLLAFLNTLTDNAFITDVKFSDPFIIFTDQLFLPAIVRD